jgi:pimeloyl-ACP methyl ester carboxylesterase
MHARCDDLSIFYDDHAGEEPALLCLPGWCAGRGAFRDLAQKLSRRVLALDWRGHGGSDRPAGDFGLAEQVRDAIAVIEASGARSVVPLATAHAGWVAIELVKQSRAQKLILVDWLVGVAPAPFLGALAAMQDANKWQLVRDTLFGVWLEGVDHVEVIRFVREDMGAYGFDMWARAGREIAAAYQRHHSPLEALAQLSVPTLHLFAQPTDPGFLQMQEEFAAAHPWFQVQRLDARSHFPTIEVPDQLVEPIARFIP